MVNSATSASKRHCWKRIHQEIIFSHTTLGLHFATIFGGSLYAENDVWLEEA